MIFNQMRNKQTNKTKQNKTTKKNKTKQKKKQQQHPKIKQKVHHLLTLLPTKQEYNIVLI